MTHSFTKQAEIAEAVAAPPTNAGAAPSTSEKVPRTATLNNAPVGGFLLG